MPKKKKMVVEVIGEDQKKIEIDPDSGVIISDNPPKLEPVKGLYENYSISQINKYLSCPRQYEYRYVKGLSQLMNSNLIFGDSTHLALEHNFEQKVHSHADLPEKEVVDKFVQNMEEKKDAPGVEWDGKFREEIDTGKKLLETYMQDHSKGIIPKAVEQQVLINIPKVSKPFIGYIDLLDVNYRIIDYKTKARTPSTTDVRRNLLQLSSYTYSMMMSRNDRKIFSEYDDKIISRMHRFETRLDFFVKTQRPKIVTMNVSRDKHDLLRFVNIVQSVCNAIENGAFYPNHGSALCSPKYCPYWEQCNKDLEEDSYVRMIDNIKKEG